MFDERDDHEHSDADAPDAPPPEQTLQHTRRAITVTDVLTEWGTAGPLVHEPTGIAALDAVTGGGPVYGTRWYVAGAPDAGKTALLVQIADVYARRGVTVGLVAVDEDAGDLVTRLAQRAGYARHHCETRDPAVLAQMADTLSSLPLRLYDARWTIEAAADDLAAAARARADRDPAAHPHGPRAMLGVDSIQTVRCEAELAALLTGREQSEVTAVTSRVHAMRSVASRHGLIAIATSEMGRGAYRLSDPAQQTSTLASAKWSGAVEYSARVLLGLHSVPNETDLVTLTPAKNKHGPRDVPIYLRLDRGCQTLIEVAYDAPPAATSSDRDGAARERVASDAIAVARVLLAQPGVTVRELRSAVRAATGMGHERVTDAVSLLGDAVTRSRGPNRSEPMTLDATRLPEPLRARLEASP